VHEKKYTILSMLAKDYLGGIAASAAVEQTFSEAADVWTNESGRLLPQTIETCVSSRLWFKEGLEMGEQFDTAEKQCNNYKLFCEEKDSKKKIFTTNDFFSYTLINLKNLVLVYLFLNNFSITVLAKKIHDY
jgi:hypothetical protein